MDKERPGNSAWELVYVLVMFMAAWGIIALGHGVFT